MIALTEQERQILALVTPVAESLGMEIVRLRIQGGRRPHLQIMAERAGGAPTNVEDCASLSRAIAPMLDEADPIKEAYTLEVSTPGIDRPLTREGDFGRWVGHAAKVELVRPIDGRRRFSGMITGEDEDGAHLELDDETEMDHFIPVKNAVAGQQVVWRALCKCCHALLSERSGGRKNPILSSFNPHLYEAFVKSAKPLPATFKANKIEDSRPLIHLDIK